MIARNASAITPASASPARPVRRAVTTTAISAGHRDHRRDEVARRQIVGAEGDEQDREQDAAGGDRQRDQRAALLARREHAPQTEPDAGEDRQRHEQLDPVPERRARSSP